jgi:hypothetical protein
MLRVLVDENFDERILDGLRLAEPNMDVVRVQDVGLDAMDDREILEWAAIEDRVLVTHDRETIPGFVKARLNAGQRVVGAIIVGKWGATTRILFELRLTIVLGDPDEWDNRITYVPF